MDVSRVTKLSLLGSLRVLSWGQYYLSSSSMTFLRMYADDSKILRRVKTLDNVNQVQVSVNNSVIWANMWQMFYHHKKCHHLHVGNNIDDTEYTMETPNGNITTEKVYCEKDLGVIFDNKLNFTEHISTKVTKANSWAHIQNFYILIWTRKCSWTYSKR